MKQPDKKILVTGGAGFIGSHVVRLLVHKYPNYHIYNLDKLTYAGNLQNVADLSDQPNYTFIKGDINDMAFLFELFQKYQFDSVVHLAAESHVDRSIKSPNEFLQTNIIGTTNLLNGFREIWEGNYEDKLFYHISTDEVYGSLGKEGLFTETTRYDPQSPYAASKASSDHFVRAFYNTYGIPYIISNCSNNYGPNQFPEKLIPLCINNIKNSQPIPIYGKGENIRDWLYVVDHAKAIDTILHQGKIGSTYNIGGGNEWTNLDLVKLLCKAMDKKLELTPGQSAQLITFVKDRAGHDLRYAIDTSKVNRELDWSPSVTFEQGLALTVDWYLDNQSWMDGVTSGDYLQYYQEQYG